MESISPDELALELLNQCLRGNSYSSELLEVLLRYALSADPAQARHASHALFSIVVERLGDLFEPCLCDCYAALFSEVIAYNLPDFRKEDLLDRFKQIRNPQPFRGPEPSTVFVLSRVTLGADIAITSRLLDAAKQRFAKARIVLVSPEKNYQIFAADPRIEHLAAPYRREGSLAERLSVYPSLRTALSTPDSIVIDPDSRLTQLGLLPVCDSDRYYFFESRAYGGFSEDTLGTLTSQWARHIFDVDTPKAFLAPGEDAGVASITVSLGVGENPAKRIAGSFERQALGLLAAAGQSMLVDRGASADEGARVDAAIMGLPNARSFTGPFAKFCGSIAKSRLYFGYDSAGQHAAAAAGVPLIAIFAGHASARFFSRWRPSGPGVCHTVRVDGQTPDSILQELATLLDQIDSR